MRLGWAWQGPPWTRQAGQERPAQERPAGALPSPAPFPEAAPLPLALRLHFLPILNLAPCHMTSFIGTSLVPTTCQV